jgi:hypothetical protein
MVDKGHFTIGPVRVMCESSIFYVYKDIIERSIEWFNNHKLVQYAQSWRWLASDCHRQNEI